MVFKYKHISDPTHARQVVGRMLLPKHKEAEDVGAYCYENG